MLWTYIGSAICHACYPVFHFCSHLVLNIFHLLWTDKSDKLLSYNISVHVHGAFCWEKRKRMGGIDAMWAQQPACLLNKS